MADVKGTCFYGFFDKKAAGSGDNIDANKFVFNNEKLAGDLHKPIIKRFKKEWFIQD